MNRQDESDASYDGIIMQVGKEVDLDESHLRLHDNKNHDIFSLKPKINDKTERAMHDRKSPPFQSILKSISSQLIHSFVFIHRLAPFHYLEIKLINPASSIRGLERLRLLV